MRSRPAAPSSPRLTVLLLPLLSTWKGRLFKILLMWIVWIGNCTSPDSTLFSLALLFLFPGVTAWLFRPGSWWPDLASVWFSYQFLFVVVEKNFTCSSLSSFYSRLPGLPWVFCSLDFHLQPSFWTFASFYCSHGTPDDTCVGTKSLWEVKPTLNGEIFSLKESDSTPGSSAPAPSLFVLYSCSLGGACAWSVFHWKARTYLACRLLPGLPWEPEGPVPCSRSLSLNWRLLVPLKWKLFEFKSTTKKKKLEQVDIVSPVSA